MPASRNEINEILNAVSGSQDLNEWALVTAVDLTGSGYRRTGARMLVHRGGNWLGAISGGCLEGNALRRARQVMLEAVPQLVTYDTRSDDSAREIGASLGCNGVLQVWIEPVTDLLTARLSQLSAAFLGDETQWFVREFHQKPEENGDCGKDWKWEDQKMAALNIVRREGLQTIYEEGKKRLFAVEKVIPATRLLVFGGGHDARPVTELARQLGWLVTVTDDCAAKAIPARFPAADQVLRIKAEEAAASLQPGPFSAALLLSHNYDYDRKVLQGLLQFDLPYIGILGPKSRFQRLDEELAGRLSARASVYGPVGLDIGGTTPFGIAVSIVAEIQAVMSGRDGTSLRDRQSGIHELEQVLT